MLIKLRRLFLIAFCLSPLVLAAAPGAVYATTQSDIQCGINQAAGSACGTAAPSSDIGGTIKTILNILSAVAGVAAVVMVMVAGLRFTTSAGNENAVKGAKSTIVYAVVGIVIVALAQVIVHFVIHAAV